MPRRLQLSDGHTTWTADVSGATVALRGGGGERSSATGSSGAGSSGAGGSSAGRGAAVEVSGSERDGYEVRGAKGAVHRGAAVVHGDAIWVSVDGAVFEFHVIEGRAGARGARDADALSPPMSATVVRIAVKPGDRVAQGDLLVALEAMKMELPIRAPRDAVVTAIHCAEGDLVQPGTALVDLE